MINGNLLAVLHDKATKPKAPVSVAGGSRSRGKQSGGGGGDDSDGDDSWSGHSH